MSINIFHVNAFVEGSFSGNPAAVCILETEANEDWMQNVATEVNLSETAFLYPLGEGYNLRWFTPTTEVDLCGHATLASAHILWDEGYLSENRDAKFSTRSGVLVASKKSDRIKLDFPSDPEHECSVPEGLIEGLGVEPIYVGKNSTDYLVELESEEVLMSLDPNMGILKKINARGIIVTSISNLDQYDFVSRFFAPASGIDEDPVTGSAHCCLGPYWSTKLGKTEFVAYQASERGGVINITLSAERVFLSGKATTVFRGEIA